MKISSIFSIALLAIFVSASKGMAATLVAEPVYELECGGHFDYPEEGDTALYSYKSAITYDNDESCFWTLNNEVQGHKSQLTLIFTLVSHGFNNSQDGLAVFNHAGNKGLYSSLLQQGSPYKVTAENIYLSFTSDLVGQGKGFVVKIEVVENLSGMFNGYNIHRPELQGYYTYGPYKDMDRISIVISPVPKQAITHSVDFIDIEKSSGCEYDFLEVYEIQNLRNFKLHSRSCGVEYPPTLSSVKNPVLVVFVTDEEKIGNGFGLSWNQRI